MKFLGVSMDDSTAHRLENAVIQGDFFSHGTTIVRRDLKQILL